LVELYQKLGVLGLDFTHEDSSISFHFKAHNVLALSFRLFRFCATEKYARQIVVTYQVLQLFLRLVTDLYFVAGLYFLTIESCL